MTKKTPSSATVPKSYLNGFVVKSTLIFALGALSSVAFLALAPQERGFSYADTFKLIAGLNRDLIVKSLTLFSFTLILIVVGIVVISIAYSHRVAGPLHKLGMHTRKIASGDLSESVRLRSSDVTHFLADDLNGLAGHYHDLLQELQRKSGELASVLDQAERQDAPRIGADPAKEISERIDEIRGLLNQIKL